MKFSLKNQFTIAVTVALMIGLTGSSCFSLVALANDFTIKQVNESATEPIAAEFPSEYVTAAAFKAGGLEREIWIPQNPEQEYLVTHLPEALANLDKIPSGLLEAASQVGSVDKVNELMRKHGLDVTLERIGPGDVSMGAVLELNGSWAGEKTTMTIAGTVYPAQTVHRVRTFEIQVNGGNLVTVVELYKRDGITVYAAKVDSNLTGLEAIVLAKALTPSKNIQPGDYSSVIMPNVSKRVTADLPGINGLTSRSGMKITQAKLGINLDMDEHGFHATEGAAYSASRGASSSFVLDGPFMVWALPNEATTNEPLFSTIVRQEDWKTPAKPTNSR